MSDTIYDTPQYDDNFEKLFLFKEFLDTETYFIRLSYWINRDKYKAFASNGGVLSGKQNTPLSSTLKARNGKDIFRDYLSEIFVSGRTWYLLQETPVDTAPTSNPNIISVEQVWGYKVVPGNNTHVHVRWETVSWTAPGWRDRTQSAGGSRGNVSYNVSSDTYTISSATGSYSPGDVVVLSSVLPYYSSGGLWVYDAYLTSGELTVISVSGSTLTTTAAPCTVAVNNPTGMVQVVLSPMLATGYNGLHPSQDTVRITLNEQYWTSWQTIGSSPVTGAQRTISKSFSSRMPQPLQVWAQVKRTYWDLGTDPQPAYNVALAPRGAAGESADMLDSWTTPTAASYRSSVSNGSTIYVADTQYGNVVGNGRIMWCDNYEARAR